MNPPTLSAEKQQALLSLLDDASPVVRKALCEHFVSLGPAALPFLRTLAQGPHRVLAWHARWFLEELKLGDPIADFRGFIRSLNYELETGTLLLGRTVNPDLDIALCCECLDAIAARCRELIVEPTTAREKCRVVNRVLFHEYGFHGNVEHYTDPDNSLLDRVLARRKGIPLSLSTVYLLVTQRLGLTLEPVGLPGHFMVGCYLDDEPFFVDPFEGGLFRSSSEIFAFLRERQISPQFSDLAPTPIREVLCRCCRNLAKHYEAAGDAPHAHLFASFVEDFEATHARHTQ